MPHENKSMDLDKTSYIKSYWQYSSLELQLGIFDNFQQLLPLVNDKKKKNKKKMDSA